MLYGRGRQRAGAGRVGGHVAGFSDGNPEYFVASMADQVGPPPRPFNSAVLYRIATASRWPRSVNRCPAGARVRRRWPDRRDRHVERVRGRRPDEQGRRLGYAAVDHADEPQFLVYAERQLNPDPNVDTRTDEPFAQLDYAIYLNEEQPDHLISSSLAERRPADRQPPGERHVGLRRSAVAAGDDTDRPAQQLAVRQPVVDHRPRRRDVLDRRRLADAEPRTSVARKHSHWPTTTPGCTTSSATSPRHCSSACSHRCSCRLPADTSPRATGRRVRRA